MLSSARPFHRLASLQSMLLMLFLAALTRVAVVVQASTRNWPECGVSNVHVASCESVDQEVEIVAYVYLAGWEDNSTMTTTTRSGDSDGNATTTSSLSCAYLMQVEWGEGSMTSSYFGLYDELVPSEDYLSPFAKISSTAIYHTAGIYHVRVHVTMIPVYDRDETASAPIPNFPHMGDGTIFATLDLSADACEVTVGGNNSAAAPRALLSSAMRMLVATVLLGLVVR